MGKSVDLPDPLESSSSQPLGNADDLLAQLAGEEVDRLLAEADAEGRQQPKPGESRRAADVSPADLAAAVTGPPPAPEMPVQDQLDALFSEITTGQPGAEPLVEPVAPAPPARVPPVSVAPIAPGPFTAVSSKLPDDIDANEVMAAIVGDGTTAPSAPPSAPSVSEQQIIPSPHPAPAAVSTTIVTTRRAEIETSAAERQGLAVPNPADELPGPGELELLAAPVEDDAPLPGYLKPLEWLNAPLDVLPPTIRDLLGQIAILTLVNAIAVLIYVFFFRRT